ncbi:L-rhamnose mutarotase [Sphingobacterium cellulitidis]|uniref:L-rhamnose mutarotase n=1 Tax=Sphingobacterium cellulitidis TaxID=1768011 RepID=UPI000B94089F|nr:L-rhamnose mutarotase [Sphingobacterium cellulitidis]OYD43734.1 L-rhamnose mutarotase [Sphingobacterium cellulitidis]OYD46990.1 L-rhamnose mutarotase [Sphingobacterium cellulitidis]
MKQVAFKMKLNAGNEAEYLRRHQEIWPKLADLLKESGVSDYAIYLDPDTLDLFAVQKLRADFDEDKLKENPIMKEWWEYMKDLMETNPDYSPKTSILKEVFYLP